MKNYLSASILAADFSQLKNEIDAVIDAGVDYIHFDVMDHHFVPNLSFGAPICRSLRKAGVSAPIDVHLMVTDPEKYIEPFQKAGANIFIFHYEVVSDVSVMIKKIKAAGMQPGIAFNPQTKVALSTAVIKQLQLILIMTVNPGFAGQSFMPDCLAKISATRKLIDAAHAETILAVDGGINDATIAQASQAGANFFVVGSNLFNADNYQHQITALREAIKA